MAESDFKAFFLSLGERERKGFALAAGTTVAYLQTHLIYARKMPRRQLFDGLARACQKHGGPSKARLLTFFYSDRDIAA